MSARTVIVHGPCCCGKTVNAARIAKALGCDSIVDDFDFQTMKLKPGALHLTAVAPSWKDIGEKSLSIYSFKMAMYVVNDLESGGKAVLTDMSKGGQQ